MKILAIGDSHCAHFKIAINRRQKSSGFRFLGSEINKHEFHFSSIPGPNFSEVSTSSSSSVIKVPSKLFRYVGSQKKSEDPFFETGVSEIDCKEFDAIIWIQGRNIFQEYHDFIGHSAAPPLMSSSLLNVFCDWFLARNQRFLDVVNSNPGKKILHIGAPVLFRESIMSPPEIPDKFHYIHNQNLRYLVSLQFPSRKDLSFIGAPFECIHPTGQFALDEFARHLPEDVHHASDSYWQFVVSHMTDISGESLPQDLEV